MLVLNEDAVIFLRKSVTMNNIKCLGGWGDFVYHLRGGEQLWSQCKKIVIVKKIYYCSFYGTSSVLVQF